MAYAALIAKPTTSTTGATVPLVHRASQLAGGSGAGLGIHPEFSVREISIDAPSRALRGGRVLQRAYSACAPTGSDTGGLAIGAPGDAYEQDADRVARQVARIPVGGESMLVAPLDLPHRGTPSGQAVGGVPASVAATLREGGRPLEPHARRDMEHAFGWDFSRVRVHDGASARTSARDVRASAYTVGSDVVFGAGQYASSTGRGRELLAHELTHVMQQADGASQPVVRRAPGDGAPQPPPVVSAGENQGRLVTLMSAWVPRAEQQRLTTISRAAAVETKTGRLVYLVAIAGEGAGAPLPPSLLAADEVLVPYAGGHAELQTIHYAQRAGYELLPGSLDPSRAFCTNCAFWARKAGLVRPDAKVRVGGTEKPLSEVPNSELTQNLEKYKRPGEGGELTAKGEAKRDAAAAAKLAKLAAAQQGAAPTAGSSPVEGPEPIAESKPGLVEGRGGPVTEIAVPDAATTMSATRGAHEGAWSMVLGWQLAYVRGAELKKAHDAFDGLSPQIEAYRQKGIEVTVTVVAEVPNQGDVAAKVTGVGDPGQVVRFISMYISHLSLPASAASSTQSTMYDAGNQDPHAVHTSEMTLNQQISAYWGQKYPVPGTGPRASFHFAEGKQVLPGYRAASPSNKPDITTPEQVKDIAGTYTPEFRQLFAGNPYEILPLALRKLQVEFSTPGVPVPKMTLASRAYAFENGGPRPPTMIMTGRFTMGKGRPPDAQWYWSSMEYHPEARGVILEWALGQDGSGNTIWDALYKWRRA
jgi:hypothetical protein